MFRSSTATAAAAGAPGSGPQRRIGVLTFHRCINYGSYWQARCLVEGLRGMGHDAVLLDHASAWVDLVEWRCAMQPLLPRRSSRADIRLYARKARAFRAAIAALPLSAPFPLESPAAMPPVDAVVVGSDEVWNLAHPWYGGWPLFFGEGVPAPTLTSYAASFGNYDADAGLTEQRAAQLGRFAAISVRDENSRRLIIGALGREPVMVLDPCLQFPPAIAAADASGADFALVYGHGFPDWFAEQARRWARSRGLRLVSLGYRNDWADEQRLDAGPLEFVEAMGQASAVLTNFFHGCVFALLNGKPFVCTVTPYRQNKVRDLTQLLGAERHLLLAEPDPQTFARVLDDPLASAITERIAELRIPSAAFLQTVLG